MTVPDRIAEWLTIHGLRIALVLVVALVVYRSVRLFTQHLVRRILDRRSDDPDAAPEDVVRLRNRLHTIESLAAWCARIATVTIAGLIILAELGIDIGPALAGLGLVGVALGFGAQQLVRDYLNGILIVVEQQFDVGDVIRAAGVQGTVENLTLRQTRLRDRDGVVYVIPNGAMSVVSNLARGWFRVREEVQIPISANVDHVVQVIDEVGRLLAEDPAWADKIIEPPVVVEVGPRAETTVTLTVRGRVRAADQWVVSAEWRRRLLDEFRRASIPIV